MTVMFRTGLHRGRCERCGQLMRTSETCQADEPRVRYGDEGIFEDRSEYRERCHDCATPLGGIHHYGCTVERCPLCGDQEQRYGCPHDDG